MAGVRQGDLHGQILRNRILRAVCGHHRRGIRDVVSFRKPEEFRIKELGASEWRIFGALQAEAMVDRTQAFADKIISSKCHGAAPMVVYWCKPFSNYVPRYHWNFLA